MRRLSEADRRAYVQRQTERRPAWQAQAAARRMPQPRALQGEALQGDGTEAVSRAKQALEALARDMARNSYSYGEGPSSR